MSETVVEWRELPDPRDPKAPYGQTCRIVLGEGAVRHISRKHIAAAGSEAEAWEAWLTPEVTAAMVAALDFACGHPGSQKAATRFAAAMESAVRAAFGRPLIKIGREPMDPSAANTAMKPLGESWLAVLPTGAILVVRRAGKRERVFTAYFLDECLLFAPHRRWREVARLMVMRYLVTNRERSAFVQSPIPPTRFVTPRNWGFRPDMEGCPWRGSLGDWPEADGGTLGDPFPLKPRRPRSP